jgi:hypothetical protein
MISIFVLFKQLFIQFQWILDLDLENYSRNIFKKVNQNRKLIQRYIKKKKKNNKNYYKIKVKDSLYIWVQQI